MNQLLIDIFTSPVVVTAITGAIAAGVTWLGAKLSALIKAKTDGASYSNGLLQVTTVVTNAVLMVEQTLVPMAAEAMKDGKLDGAEKTKLYQAAWNAIMGALGGDAGVEKIAKMMSMSRPQFELFVSHAIEASVFKLTGTK